MERKKQLFLMNFVFLKKIFVLFVEIHCFYLFSFFCCCWLKSHNTQRGIKKIVLNKNNLLYDRDIEISHM